LNYESAVLLLHNQKSLSFSLRDSNQIKLRFLVQLFKSNQPAPHCSYSSNVLLIITLRRHTTRRRCLSANDLTPPLTTTSTHHLYHTTA